MSSVRWRSLLFAPADNADRSAKAARAGADAVILDLEDSVGTYAKPIARAYLTEAADLVRTAGSAVVVRINADWKLAVEDIKAALAAGADAVMVPKVEDVSRLQTLSEFIESCDPGGACRLIALVESPRGILALPSIAGFPGLIGLALGTEDFSLALGVQPSGSALDLPSRQMALAAGAYGVMALAVPISIAQFRDTDAYMAAAQAGAAYGVTGAICIHPAQVKVANACFGVTSEQLGEAHRIMVAWQDAAVRGLSVTSLDGMMIDLPVAERARQMIARCPTAQTEAG